MKLKLFLFIFCAALGLFLQLNGVSYGAKYICEPEDLNDASSLFAIYDTTSSPASACNKYVGSYYNICLQTYNKNKQAYQSGKCTPITIKEYTKGNQKCQDMYYGNETTPSTTCTEGKIEYNPNFRRN